MVGDTCLLVESLEVPLATMNLADYTMQIGTVQTRDTDSVDISSDFMLLNVRGNGEVEDQATGGAPIQSTVESAPTSGDKIFNDDGNQDEEDDEALSDVAQALPPTPARVQGPVQVVIFGDSFIRNLSVFMSRRYGGYHNMNINYSVADIHMYGIGGMTAARAIENHMDIFDNIQPTIVYVQLGSNDLSSPHTSMNTIIANIRELGRKLVNRGVRRIIFGQVLMRHGRGLPLQVPDYNERVLDFNHELWSGLPISRLPAYFWRHRGFWLSQFALMADDGIHLNARGNGRYYRSIRGSLLFAMTSLNISFV